MATADLYIQTHSDRFLEELKELIRIPSISTLKSHTPEIERAAHHVKEALLRAGASHAELICSEAGHPLVYGEHIIDPKLPTVLVYGHYDVQPVDPLHLWDSPPFEPTIRDGKIYARGAADDKGQMFAHIKALETAIATGTLPCNVKFLIEGEEECGSGHISAFLQKKANAEKVKADVVLVSDTSVVSMEQPSVQISLRGMASLEVTVKGPARDLHSGVYGGAVANPLQELCHILSALKSKNGKVAVPGFYADVLAFSSPQRAAINAEPFDIEAYKKDLGVAELAGEEGFSTLERVGIRPTLELNGIWGGYTGEGTKTILPASAHAKITMRLVPYQDPRKIEALVRDHILSLASPSVEVEVRVLTHGSPALYMSPDCDAVRAASRAFEAVWGKRPICTHEGGSIPVLSQMTECLKTEIALLGFGLNSDNIHSPNESFGVANFYKGIRTILAFYDAFSKMKTAAAK